MDAGTIASVFKEKQNNLASGIFVGNIDNVPAENSIYWIHSTEASGTMPISDECYFQLHNYYDKNNTLQKAFIYKGDSIDEYYRMYCNNAWTTWSLTTNLNNITSRFKGNIDDINRNINYWVYAPDASGTMPMSGNIWFVLQSLYAIGNRIQIAYIFTATGQLPYVYLRFYCNYVWSSWGKISVG